MKTALITTTINVPTVLALYRKYGPDVRFFIAGDHKTPHQAVENLLLTPFGSTEHYAYYSVEDQQKLGYACSELIGWNCIQRRNIALLEALKWGADVIVSVDDDNIPLNQDYFADFIRALGVFGTSKLAPPGVIAESFHHEPTFNGLLASSPTGWFDVGQMLQPRASHRGFPHTKAAQPEIIACTDVKIGVAAGICLGDPDISAVERIANGPIVHNVSELLHSGVVTDPRNTWTVFNSQNTAFIRELAPAMFMIPGIGRYDDIFASLICQRVMREKGYHVHFGKPFVWQQRNQHDLIKDLKAEIYGMENVAKFTTWLDDFVFEPGIDSVLAQTRYLYEHFNDAGWMPKQSIEAGLAWCDDVESVL